MTRKKAAARFLAVIIVLGAGMLPVPGRAAEDNVFDFELSLDSVAKYIWRGIEVNDESVLQPSLTISPAACGFSFNVWANYDLTDGGREDNFSEVDYTASYGFDIPDSVYSVELGVIEYYFPGPGGGSDTDTREAYVGISAGVVLSPSLTVYYDFAEIDGWYVTAGVSHSFSLATWHDNLSLDLGASIGWGDDDYNVGYHGVDDSGLNDLTASVGLSYAASDNLSFAATLSFAEMLDSDIEKAVDAGGDSDNAFFGVNITVAF